MRYSFFFRTPATIIIAEARLILLAICGVVCRLVESLNHWNNGLSQSKWANARLVDAAERAVKMRKKRREKDGKWQTGKILKTIKIILISHCSAVRVIKNLWVKFTFQLINVYFFLTMLLCVSIKYRHVLCVFPHCDYLNFNFRHFVIFLHKDSFN